MKPTRPGTLLNESQVSFFLIVLQNSIENGSATRRYAVYRIFASAASEDGSRCDNKDNRSSGILARSFSCRVYVFVWKSPQKCTMQGTSSIGLTFS